ncbi:MAG: hypothetical protein OXE78_12715, partial [Gammaproteobacteria bacterium]|nr:hypothetical protein [Gammaproteobacteria bacterium]
MLRQEIMNSSELQNIFASLNVWQSHGKRAPNKPLLAIWAIGCCLQGKERLVPYKQIEEVRKGLLGNSGPRGKIGYQRNPFWLL